MGSKIPGTCYSGKKKAPARKPANSRPEWGSTPDGPSIKVQSWFWSKNGFFQKSITSSNQ